MGLFGVPPRAADHQAVGHAEGACPLENDDGVRRPEEDVVAGSCRLEREARWESEIAAAGPGRGRKRSGAAAGGNRGLVRNRGRRGRAVVGTAIISAMTLSQGEGSK